TSVGTTRVEAAPAAEHSAATSSREVGPRAASTRWAPTPAAATAVARPMPLEAPVMTTTSSAWGELMDASYPSGVRSTGTRRAPPGDAGRGSGSGCGSAGRHALEVAQVLDRVGLGDRCAQVPQGGLLGRVALDQPADGHRRQRRGLARPGPQGLDVGSGAVGSLAIRALDIPLGIALRALGAGIAGAGVPVAVPVRVAVPVPVPVVLAVPVAVPVALVVPVP